MPEAAEFERAPEANHHLPTHPGRVQLIVDRARSRPSRYVYKHVVVLHDRYDVDGLPKDLDGWHKLLNRVGQEFERAGMPEPYVEVEVEIEQGSYGDGDSAKGSLHFGSMRDATPEEAKSYDDWKAQQERIQKASERAHLERRLRELGG